MSTNAPNLVTLVTTPSSVMPGLQVGDLLDVVLKTGREEFIARVASRLAEFFENVVQGVDAGGEAALVDLLQQRGLFGSAAQPEHSRLCAICSTTGYDSG